MNHPKEKGVAPDTVTEAGGNKVLKRKTGIHTNTNFLSTTTMIAELGPRQFLTEVMGYEIGIRNKASKSGIRGSWECCSLHRTRSWKPLGIKAFLPIS